jgi:hypothetical protein
MSVMMSKMSETNLNVILLPCGHYCNQDPILVIIEKNIVMDFIVYVSSIEGDLRTLVLEVCTELFVQNCFL